MMAAARWLSQTAASTAIRDIDWLIPVLQSIHILAIAMVMSSVLMIDLRVLQFTRGQMMVATVRRFEAWIWSGLVLLAATGTPLIVAEPKRMLPNVSFQLKLVLLVLAAATTAGLCRALRRNRGFRDGTGEPGRVLKFAAVGGFLLWCAVAAAGRFIAYTQPY